MTYDEDPIDPSKLAELREIGDDEFVAELAQMYLAELGPRLDAIDAAVALGDPANAAICIHALSGSSANLGLTQLAAVAKMLEQHYRGEPQDDPQALLSELHLRAEQASRRLGQLAA